MTIQKTKIKIEKLNTIFHISDIHIRLFKRKDEYIDVFNNLYKELESRKSDDAIIVVAGDIVHGKTEMSPELVDLTSDFFKNLGDIMPTIVVPGNHDANLNNMSRLDALSPIIKTLNHPNVHYFTDSALYKVADTVFSMMSVLEPVDNYILADKINFDGTKIAIFHGPIDSALSDTGWKITNEKIKTNLFDGFDIALLGDIHKYQVLQEYREIKDSNGNIIKKPIVCYPGSLIQQNYGESIDKHGFLIWNVENKDYEFVKIPNKYGFITVDIKNGVVTSDLSEMPSKPRMRLRVDETSQSELKECLADLRSKYSPIEVSINRSNVKGMISDDQERIDLSHIREVSFQNALIEDYLTRNHDINKKVMQKIFDINEHLNKLLPVEDIIRNIIWKPKLFKFSNMFSYGPNNVIDFSKIHGLAGLFSANASGKTSLLESLTFCLFDRCSKTFKASNILNNRKDKFVCELHLDIAGEEYIIKRTAVQSKTGTVSVKVNFDKVLPDGTLSSLNGEQRKDTNNVIKSYIGTYEDFILTAVSSQNNSANFIDKTNTERKDLLNAFMDITIFDALYDIGAEEIRDYQVLLKEYEKNDYEGEIAELDVKIEKYDNEYKLLKISRDSVSDEKKKIDDEILSLVKTIISVDDSIKDIDFLERKKESNQKLLKENDEKMSLYTEKLLSLKAEHQLSVELLKKLSDGNIIKRYEDLNNLETELNNLLSKIEKFKIEINHKKEKTQKLRELKYDPNCEFCMDNIFVKDAILARKELENDKVKAESLIAQRNELKEKIKLFDGVKEEYNNYLNSKNKEQSLNMEILKLQSSESKLQSECSSLNSEIDKLTSKIEIYYKSKEDIEKNKKTEEEISKLKLKISDLNVDLGELEDELRECHSKKIFLEDKKKTDEEYLHEFKEMEEKHESYKYYLEAVHRDAVPYELISKTIPSIEKEVNNILSQIVSFVIMLDLDGKNINARIVYDEDKYWPLEMASGMERFITGIAIRVALINISNLPRPNFLAIDEGFSSLDSDNSSNLPMIFDYLKTQFDFVFTISHMDYIRDFVDISLDLKKEDDFSKITFK